MPEVHTYPLLTDEEIAELKRDLQHASPVSPAAVVNHLRHDHIVGSLLRTLDLAREVSAKQNCADLIDYFREVAPRQTTSRNVEIERLTPAPGDWPEGCSITVIIERDEKGQTEMVAAYYEDASVSLLPLTPEQFTDLCSVMREYIPEPPEDTDDSDTPTIDTDIPASSITFPPRP